MKYTSNQLPKVAFSILLALSLKPRHGYEIIKQIKEDSDGKINLGPGALYTSIKQLREAGLIQEEATQDQRRRYYRLTAKGVYALAMEIEYYESAVKLARERNPLFGGTHV